jgi:alanyl aminopeptidase
MISLGRLAWGLLAADLALAAPPVFLLPEGVAPRKHSVELTIDPSQSVFQGRMRIEIDLRVPTATLWLNAKDLTISEAALTLGARRTIARVTEGGGEFAGLEFDAPLGPGAGAIELQYRGRLDEKARSGVYRRRVSGDWYAYTVFTPIEARRAFPCFDEPRFKTPWEIAIRVRGGHRAFSNGRELSSTDEPGGWKLVRFAATDPIPAEVVAFAVGPFDVFDGGVAGAETPVRVITPKGRSADGAAAARATAMVLPRLEAYTGIRYPFGKLDHVAVADGEFGAVENPGLITYRARSLLVEPGADSLERTRPLRRLQAHEIGHQWFGNLVTQADWRDVWLSEGFATWIAAKVMDQEQPRERAHLASVAARERVMAADTSANTRPVRFTVSSREASAQIYNRFVYDKGAAVLTMLEAWLGEEKFQQGIRAYLNTHRFGNASTYDLAAALRTASGSDPTPVMSAFLDTGGAPEVRGEVECEKRAELRIHQTGSAAVPICWRTDSAGARCDVLEGALRAIELAACPAWVYLNAGGTGYYRTTWTAAALARLEPARLTAAERLTLVYDLRAQKADRAAARETLRKLSKDPEPEIARAASDGLR